MEADLIWVPLVSAEIVCEIRDRFLRKSPWKELSVPKHYDGTFLLFPFFFFQNVQHSMYDIPVLTPLIHKRVLQSLTLSTVRKSNKLSNDSSVSRPTRELGDETKISIHIHITMFFILFTEINI